MNGRKIKNFKDLNIWNDSIGLVEIIYKLTKAFPKEETYGITNQIRRSSVSIPSNIAEGFMRKHNKEFKQFLFIALGSCAELETQIIIASKLNYISKSNFDEISENIDKLNRMIMSLIKRL